jgi:hypothetical protein
MYPLVPAWFDRLFALFPLVFAGCAALVALSWLTTALALPLFLLRQLRHQRPALPPTPPPSSFAPAGVAPAPITPDAVLQRWESWADPVPGPPLSERSL